MQQTPGYQEQEPLRKEYVPQQPSTRYEGQRAPGVSAAAGRQAGPLSWSDWVRWGPIWSGFFTIVATLVVLGALGAGIALTVWGPGTNRAFDYGWSILIGIIAYFLGGWVTARSAGVAGAGAAILNSALAWALSLVAIMALAVVGAGNVVGSLGSNLYLLLHTSTSGGAPTMTTGNVATTAWVTFAALVIGLVLAIIGGLVGSRSLPEWRKQRTL